MSNDKETLADKIKKGINEILPNNEVELSDIKEEMWEDLSLIYYKYGDNDQKRAFREVLKEIADNISDDNWKAVYNRLYNKHKEDKKI